MCRILLSAPYARRIKAFLLLGALLAVTAYSREEIRYQEVDEIKKRRFENELENNLANKVRALLGSDDFLVQVRSRMREAVTYLIPDEVPVDQRSPVPPFQFVPSAPTPAATLLEQLPELGQPAISGADDSGGIVDPLEQALPDAELPGVPIFADREQYGTERFAFSQALQALQRQYKEQNKAILQLHQSQQEQRQQQQIDRLRQQEESSQSNQHFRRSGVPSPQALHSRTEIQRLAINVWLPEEIRRQQMILIEDLITEQAQLDLIRGDTLDIVLTKFPVKAQQDSFPSAFSSPSPVAGLSSTPANQVSQGAARWLDELLASPTALWLAGLLLLLLLLWAARTLFFRKKPPLGSDQTAAALSPATAPSASDGRFASQSPDGTLKQLKWTNEEINSRVLLHPGMCEQLLDNPPESMRRESVAGLLIGNLGLGVFNRYSNHALDPDSLEEAVSFAESMDGLPRSEQQRLASDVLAVLRRFERAAEAAGKKETGTIKPFDFLTHLTDAQIIYLLSTEEAQYQALALSQLPERRSGAILTQLSAEKQAEVAIAMGNLQDIPIEVYRPLANSLARKSQDLPEFESVQVDGTETLVRAIAQMDAAGEATMLNVLKKDSPDQYYRIRKVYMGFADIPQMPAPTLKNFLREFERETIATALYDEEESFRDTLLSRLPDRSRALTVNTIDSMDLPDSATINAAKGEMASKAREWLKAKIFELPDEEESSPASQAVYVDAHVGDGSEGNIPRF